MKRFLSLILVLLLVVSVFTACDEATLNGAVEVEKENSENETESKDTTTSDGTPMLRINEQNNKWEISTDGGKTWKNTGVSATGENGTNGTNGANGSDGKDGANGANGENGKDGNGILKIEVIDNNVWITYTSNPNTPVNVGKVTVSAYDLDFYPLPDGTYGVKAGNSIYAESIIIPSTYNGKTVTRILSEGFKDAVNLKEITIPNSITIIEKYAFSNCEKLTSITLPNSITRIEMGAFYGCYGLSSITIPKSVTYMGEKAFFHIPFTDVYYEGTIASWCNITFDGFGYDGMDFDYANPITLAENFYVKNTSGEYELVEDVVIPEGVESIGAAAFLYYGKLSSITLPSTLKKIGACAFTFTGITSITIPKSVTEVEKLAFWGCPFERIYFDGTLEEWNSIYFHTNPSGEWSETSNPLKKHPFDTSAPTPFYTKNASGEYVETTP